MARPKLTGTHLFLIVVVAVAATTIAGIGFLGSYTAVRELAVREGFGRFSALFPIGVDAGIIALLALDLLLSWFRIPFPLLRQTAWLLTVATVAMNAASAWPHPLGVGMHAVIPLLFVVIAEAVRHAISRLAKLSDIRRMESVRFMRWLLSPFRTFSMWRRMMLWELRSVDEAVRLEQMRLAYAMLLEEKYGKAWETAAPRTAVLPLRLAKLGVPLYRTADQGLSAAGLSGSAFASLFSAPEVIGITAGEAGPVGAISPKTLSAGVGEVSAPLPSSHVAADDEPAPAVRSGEEIPSGRKVPVAAPEGVVTTGGSWVPAEESEWAAQRPSGDSSSAADVAAAEEENSRPGEGGEGPAPLTGPEELQTREDQLFYFYCRYVERHGQQPEKHLFADFIYREFGQAGQSGAGPISVQSLRRYWGTLETRYRAEVDGPLGLERVPG